MKIVKNYNELLIKKLILISAYVSGSSIHGNVRIDKGDRIYQSHVEGNMRNRTLPSSLWVLVFLLLVGFMV